MANNDIMGGTFTYTVFDEMSSDFNKTSFESFSKRMSKKTRKKELLEQRRKAKELENDIQDVSFE